MRFSIFALAFAGLLFSGYQSWVKFFNQICAIDSCPYFLGYPACYFGFGLFLLLTIFSIWLVLSKGMSKYSLWGVIILGFAGTLFAGNYTIQELPLLFEQGFSAYALGLPTCAWGLVMYVAIMILGLVTIVKDHKA